MKKITDSLSKEIIAAAEGEIAGIVTNGYTDAKLSKLRGCKVSSEERDEGLLLPLDRILGEGDALVVRNLGALNETNRPECPIGAKVYDTLGRFYGVLRDVCYEEQNGKVLSLLTQDSELDPATVLCFGKNAVVLRAPAHEKLLFRKKSKAPRRPAAKKQSSKPLLATQAEMTLVELSAWQAPAPAEETQALAPIPVEQSTMGENNYNFLLGRTVVKSIGKGSDLIAREDEIVTAELLRKARLKGKLVELTVNSRK